jgi:rod shape determining protein RodA
MTRKLWSFDLGIFIPVLILSLLSLVTLYSLNPDFFRGQFILLLVSIAAFFFFSQTDINILKMYAKPIYIFSIIVLAVVLIIGIEARGAVRWVEFLGFRIQFSEIVKPFLAVSMAAYLSQIRNFNLREFVKILLFLSPIFILINLQPDLGNALIYGLVVILTLLFIGFPFKYFVGIFLLGVVSFPFVFNLLHDYQKQRLLTFINPSADPLGTSYNAIQSTIAVGAGMFSGKGIGLGTQSGLRFLPERQTDFIFASISEQLGFIGVTILFISFIYLFYKIFYYITNSENHFQKVFLSIFFFLILVQLFLNVGMNVGIMPIVGITLPFVSYGGSSLLSNFIFLGLLASISKSYKKREVLSIG